MTSERDPPHPDGDAEPVTGLVIVDHGSRRPESNAMLLDVVALFRQRFDHPIVEPAHMELAEPSIATAVDRCVRQGATRIVVFPYFLAPGRHWDQDIPRLAREATSAGDGISILVTAPIGLHPLMAEIIEQRVQACLRHAAHEGPSCQWCEGTDKCQWQANEISD